MKAEDMAERNMRGRTQVHRVGDRVPSRVHTRPSRAKPRAYLRLIGARKRPFARIRRAVSRCFAADGQLITVRQVLQRSYPRAKLFKSWHYHSARRALRQVAVIVACSRYGRGRPSLWAVADYAPLSQPKKKYRRFNILVYLASPLSTQNGIPNSLIVGSINGLSRP